MLRTLPLFQAYGEAWLAIIEERAALCESGGALPEEDSKAQSEPNVSYELLARLRTQNAELKE